MAFALASDQTFTRLREDTGSFVVVNGIVIDQKTRDDITLLSEMFTRRDVTSIVAWYTALPYGDALKLAEAI